MTDTENDQEQRYRFYWTTCDDCLVSLRVEAHPDMEKYAGIPDPTEWDNSWADYCPMCGTRTPSRHGR